MNSSAILHFAKTISGCFSNHQQAQAEPSKFSHINIFFRPFPWEIFRGPWFYSEQSYDYDPWRPYRQGLHHLIVADDHLLMLNFGLRNGIRTAGAGSRPELLSGIVAEDLIPRPGCAMVFRQKQDGSFWGEVEPGCKCMIPRDGRLTYLVSEIEFGEDHWVSRDRGLDPSTNAYLWGAENGPLRFSRSHRYGDHLDEAWLLNDHAIS